MSSTIVSFGEALWDLLPTGPVLGGAPLNYAYRMNSLGHRGLIISRLGKDELGIKAHEQILTLQMEDICLQWDNTYPTGTVKIFFDDDKNPDYTIIKNVAYDHIEFSASLVNIIKDAECFCFGTLAQRNTDSRQTLQRLLSIYSGKFTLLDINLRKNCYSDETLNHSLEQANIVKLNEDELGKLAILLGLRGNSAPDQAEHLLRHFDLDYCVVSLGERGAFALSRQGEKIYSPGYHVSLVDPCGAGDGFAAGFSHALLEGKSLKQACRLGNALGAMVAQQEGATHPIANQEAVAFMDAGYPDRVDQKISDYLT